MASPYGDDIPLTTVVTAEPSSARNHGNPEGTPARLTGLGPLEQAQSLTIRQRVRCMDICSMYSGCEVEKKYTIHGPNGEIMLWARELSSCIMRFCLGNIRSLNIKLTDSTTSEVVELHRPLNCMGCCCAWCYPHCTQELSVALKGEKIGTIRERATWIYPVYHLFDPLGQQTMKIRGPFWTMGCCDDVNFHVLNTDGIEVATIVKKWMGCCRETLIDADNFVVQFKDSAMAVQDKVMILSAAFLIDLMYYESES
eukprot:maker-scaffold1305_size49401-snap-gene-0.22 protein:Tk01702 transcript:maker-scaffold1305_size49401-snap-gene-0.22-mRNA-1 annotation:"phospholipid scramblase 2"